MSAKGKQVETLAREILSVQRKIEELRLHAAELRQRYRLAIRGVILSPGFRDSAALFLSVRRMGRPDKMLRLSGERVLEHWLQLGEVPPGDALSWPEQDQDQTERELLAAELEVQRQTLLGQHARIVCDLEDNARQLQRLGVVLAVDDGVAK